MIELSKEEFLEKFGLVEVQFNSFCNKRFSFNSIKPEPHVAVSVMNGHIDTVFVNDVHYARDLNVFSGMATVGDEIYHFYEVEYE